MIGQFIDGYEIMQAAGRGRAATLFVARQHPVERYVAVKVFETTVAADRLQQLGAQLQNFDHTHILPVYATGLSDRRAYWVLRYMPAGTLETKLRTHRFTPDETNRLLAQLAAALDYAHQHGLVHGNLKPSNILLDHSGNGFVADFGLDVMPSDYQAPELRRTPTPDVRSDVYSLAAMVYELLTSHWAQTSIVGDQPNRRLAEVPKPSTINTRLPAALDAVLLKALAIDPDQRYATPLDFAGAFSQARAPQPSLPIEIAASEPAIAVRRVSARRSVGDNRWLAIGAIGLVIVIGLIAVLTRQAPVAAPNPIDTPAPTRTVETTSAPAVQPVTTNTPLPLPSATLAPTSLPTNTAVPSVAVTPTVIATATRTLAPRRIQPTATPTLTIESFVLMIPRSSDRALLSLTFRTRIRPDNISPIGTLSMSVPAVEPLVISRDLADVGVGEQVLRVGIRIDCGKAFGPLTSDRVVVTLTDKGGKLLASQSFEYVKRWCE